MKKLIALLLVAVICLSLVACAGKKQPIAPTENDAPQPIALTEETIGDYIAFTGSFSDSLLQRVLHNVSSHSVLNFSAYPTVPGSFSNVEITVQANIPDSASGYHWNRKDVENDSSVEFTFKLSATGTYENSYAIVCGFCSELLSGNCDFTIVSASGTFTPSN